MDYYFDICNLIHPPLKAKAGKSVFVISRQQKITPARSCTCFYIVCFKGKKQEHSRQRLPIGKAVMFFAVPPSSSLVAISVLQVVFHFIAHHLQSSRCLLYGSPAGRFGLRGCHSFCIHQLHPPT